MPLFDLKRAYTDHIKSLNPEERKTFGRNLMQAMQDVRAARIAEMPPLPEGEPPIPPAGLFGERFVSLGELAVRFADGRYSAAEGEALDRMLDNELDTVFYGITEDEAGLDNSLLNELLARRASEIRRNPAFRSIANNLSDDPTRPQKSGQKPVRGRRKEPEPLF